MSENFKISEIARLFGISSDTLRFYEKKGLLKPSVNELNHYRSYELTDINLLIDILFYRRLDLSLQDIHTILYQGDLDQLQQTLTIKEAEIKAQIEEQKLILKKLALTAQNVDEIKAAMGDVKIQPMQLITCCLEVKMRWRLIARASGYLLQIFLMSVSWSVFIISKMI